MASWSSAGRSAVYHWWLIFRAVGHGALPHAERMKIQPQILHCVKDDRPEGVAMDQFSRQVFQLRLAPPKGTKPLRMTHFSMRMAI